MRPHRVRLTHSLGDNNKLGERMLITRPVKRSEYQISQFHADGTFPPPYQTPTLAYGDVPRQHHATLTCLLDCAAEYLDFLKRVTPDNQEEFMTQMRRFNLGPVGEADCPVFDGMFDYFQASAWTDSSGGGVRLLLHQRHRAGHPGAAEDPPAVRAAHISCRVTAIASETS